MQVGFERKFRKWMWTNEKCPRYSDYSSIAEKYVFVFTCLEIFYVFKIRVTNVQHQQLRYRIENHHHYHHQQLQNLIKIFRINMFIYWQAYTQTYEHTTTKQSLYWLQPVINIICLFSSVVAYCTAISHRHPKKRNDFKLNPVYNNDYIVYSFH